MIPYSQNPKFYSYDDMSVNSNNYQLDVAFNKIFSNSQDVNDLSLWSPMMALHQAAQGYMLKNLNNPSRFRSDSIFSVNSALSNLTENTWNSSIAHTPSDMDFSMSSNDQSKRSSYQSFRTSQTDCFTLIEPSMFQLHNINHNIRTSLKASKVLGIDSQVNFNKPRSRSNILNHSKSMLFPQTKFKLTRRDSSIRSLFQTKSRNSKMVPDDFCITLGQLHPTLHAWVEVLIHSKSKSLFRPYKRCYLALNKNIIYKFNNDEPDFTSSDELALSSVSTIHVPYYSKSGRCELEVTNPNATWLIRFSSQALLLQWLDALSMAQNRVSQPIHKPNLIQPLHYNTIIATLT